MTYPSMESLKAEDSEQQPFLVFEIRDAQGDVVARYKEDKMKKGLNQSTWDFRLEATSPVKLKEDDGGRYGSPDNGPLALPGEYTVTIHQFHNGELSQLAEPQPFKVKSLHDSQITPANRVELTQFIERVNEARKDMRRTAEEMKDLKKQVEIMSAVVMKTPNADAAWLAEIDEADKTLTDIEYALSGDKTRSKRQMETYPGILFRIEVIAENIKSHTEAPTQSEKRSLDVAMVEHAALELQLKEVKQKVDGLAKKLKDAGAPYFKG